MKHIGILVAEAICNKKRGPASLYAFCSQAVSDRKFISYLLFSPRTAGIAIQSRVCVCVRKIEGGYVVGPEMAIAICVFPEGSL